MRESKEEHPCKLVDISAGGAAVMSPVAVPMGERVVAYFDHIGGIEGMVGAGVRWRLCLQDQRDAAQAREAGGTADLARQSLRAGALDGRRHERVTPKNGDSALQLAEGIMLTCRVLDVSISGASIATPARPEIGTEVMLGKLRARVVRHHPQGFGVQFLDIQNPTALRRHFG